MNDDEYFRIMVDYATRLIKDTGGIKWWEPVGAYRPVMGILNATNKVQEYCRVDVHTAKKAVEMAVENLYSEKMQSVADSEPEKRPVFDAKMSGQLNVTSITEVMRVVDLYISNMSIGDVELRFDYSKSEWTLKIYR